MQKGRADRRVSSISGFKLDWWVCGTDERQEGTASKPLNVAGAVEGENGEEAEVAVGTATKGRKGKERAREVKGKGVKKGEEGSEAEEEEGTKGEGVGASTTLDVMDTLCNKAIFGYCRVDLFNPPAPLHFGLFNKRPLVEAQAKKFAMTVGSTNVRPFGRNNLLPLVISKEDVEAESYDLKANVEKAPMLKLKAEVVGRADYGLKLAGGRHRHRAMQMLREKSKELVIKLRDKLTEAQRGLGESEAGGKKHEKLKAKIEELEELLNVEKEVEKNVSVWGVILYDLGWWSPSRRRGR